MDKVLDGRMNHLQKKASFDLQQYLSDAIRYKLMLMSWSVFYRCWIQPTTILKFLWLRYFC